MLQETKFKIAKYKEYLNKLTKLNQGEKCGKSGEVLENVGKVWESVVECGGSVGKHGEVRLGRGVGNVLGRGEGNVLDWGEVGVWEDVGRGLGRVKKCGQS